MKPTSILLPTKKQTDVIHDLSKQMSPEDELLVVCDSEEDPVADIDTSDNVRLIKAGEPEGCSGKANAIAEGMEEAKNERIVWTDDDFDHPEDWLSQMHMDCDDKGAVSELPFFVGKDYLNMMLEPIYASAMSLVYFSDKAWGGSLMFDRDELDEEKFLEKLRQTISDGVLVSDHLNITVLRRSRRVELDDDVRSNVERIVRFTQTARYNEKRKLLAVTAASPVIAALLIIYPLAGISVSTFGAAAAYTLLDEERLTFMFAYLSALVAPMFLIYSLTRDGFKWQGREYHYKNSLDVEIE